MAWRRRGGDLFPPVGGGRSDGLPGGRSTGRGALRRLRRISREPDGTWCCTVWQPTKKTTIVKVELAPDGTWRPAENYDVVTGLKY